jgi:hypothetical protein
VVDAVDSTASHPDDPSIAHADVERASVRAENAGRLHPFLDLATRVLVDANGPVITLRVRGPGAPRIGDPVGHRRKFLSA